MDFLVICATDTIRTCSQMQCQWYMKIFSIVFLIFDIQTKQPIFFSIFTALVCFLEIVNSFNKCN